MGNEFIAIYPILIDCEWNIDPQHTTDCMLSLT